MLQCRERHRQRSTGMLELGVKFLIAYFVGSLMGAMIVGRIRGGVDIRTMGSGNAGGTNALRTQGIVFALGVVIIAVSRRAADTTSSSMSSSAAPAGAASSRLRQLSAGYRSKGITHRGK